MAYPPQQRPPSANLPTLIGAGEHLHFVNANEMRCGIMISLVA